MVSNTWDLNHRPETRGRLAGATPLQPKNGRGSLPVRAVAALVRWLAVRNAHARRRDELARLPDALRADIGLPPREPPATADLRFIATPDRLAVFAPGHSATRRR